MFGLELPFGVRDRQEPIQVEVSLPQAADLQLWPDYQQRLAERQKAAMSRARAARLRLGRAGDHASGALPLNLLLVHCRLNRASSIPPPGSGPPGFRRLRRPASRPSDA